MSARAIVAVVALLAVGCAPKQRLRPGVVRHVDFSKHDVFELEASPRLAMCRFPLATMVHLRAVIHQARDFTCPSFEWSWPDGTRSFEEADCDASAAPDEIVVRKHIPLGCGEFDFHVLAKQGKLEARATVHVTVAGGE